MIQVKQKFGGLKFYMANQTGEIRALLQASFLICEVCGQHGKGFNDDGWYRTKRRDNSHGLLQEYY